MASIKRHSPLTEQSQHKKPRVDESVANLRVVLNPADCDLDFNVEGNGLQGSALYEEGFAYCWSGARANMGITGGKYCFGCKILSAQPVEMGDTALDQQHLCRVGISRGDDAVRNIGETVQSFGFGGTGKFSNSGNFIDYGEKFGVGDTITCSIDLESKPMATIGFSKNGKWLGVAKHFDAGQCGLGVIGSSVGKLQWGSALFPHVLLKNVIVQMQFSIGDGLIPQEGYKPWASAILDGNSVLGPSLSNQHDCEMIMMVGLPASGKTTWAEKWVKEHPEKRYVLLGTNLALEQMKVPGLLRKHNYAERFEKLMDRATKIFNVLLSRASSISRNFIIDQTNVYKSARRRKLKPFANYKKIAVVVFPRPEELKLRAEKRFKEMGKEVPAEAVNEMLANFTLPMSRDMPRTDEYFDLVLYVELSEAESQRSLDVMKREMSLKPSMPPCPRESNLTTCSTTSLQHLQEGPNQSCTGPVFENQGPPFGSFYSNPPGHDPRQHELDYTQSSSSYDNTRMNYHAYPGGISNDNPYNCSGLESGQFVHGSTPYGISAMRPHVYHSAAPFPYGSNETPIPRPPYGVFPNNMQQSGVYPLPSPPRPPNMDVPMDVQHSMAYHGRHPPRGPSLNIPMDGQHSGAYPQHPWGY